MASNCTHLQPHYVLFPFMAQGHMIPMVDIARMLAQQGIKITIITTPLNAARFRSVLARAVESGLPIQTIQLPFPCQEVGLPEGCEFFDKLTSPLEMISFLEAADMLQKPAEKVFEEMLPRPSCIISDFCLPYAARIASKLHIPRYSFHGTCCFYLVCTYKVYTLGILDSIPSDSEHFVIPDLPHRIELSASKVPLARPYAKVASQIIETDLNCYGVIANTFEELEPAYVKELKKSKAEKVWCVGPVSLCNKEELDRNQRGCIPSVDEQKCLKWLDSWEPSSVLYACLGSLCGLPYEQVTELGLGLEASNRPFIWVVRDANAYKEFKNWVSESGFEERTKDRGLLIKGWAPQLSILSHPAVGGFLTHCGWNSILEGITAGVPLITWPLFADQFCDEKLVQILEVGVSVGADVIVLAGLEDKVGVPVKKEDVNRAVDKLFAEGEEGKQRRERARELQRLAKRATEEGGSSYNNLKLFIEDVTQQTCKEI